MKCEVYATLSLTETVLLLQAIVLTLGTTGDNVSNTHNTQPSKPVSVDGHTTVQIVNQAALKIFHVYPH